MNNLHSHREILVFEQYPDAAALEDIHAKSDVMKSMAPFRAEYLNGPSKLEKYRSLGEGYLSKL